jgi:hypothetical protein
MRLPSDELFFVVSRESVVRILQGVQEVVYIGLGHRPFGIVTEIARFGSGFPRPI